MGRPFGRQSLALNHAGLQEAARLDPDDGDVHLLLIGSAVFLQRRRQDDPDRRRGLHLRQAQELLRQIAGQQRFGRGRPRSLLKHDIIGAHVFERRRGQRGQPVAQSGQDEHQPGDEHVNDPDHDEPGPALVSNKAHVFYFPAPSRNSRNSMPLHFEAGRFSQLAALIRLKNTAIMTGRGMSSLRRPSSRARATAVPAAAAAPCAPVRRTGDPPPRRRTWKRRF